MQEDPTVLLSKRQNSVETPTPGSDLAAVRSAIKMIEALRCKLRAFEVPTEGPTTAVCDSGAVRASATRPGLTLTKKRQPSRGCFSCDSQSVGGARAGELGWRTHKDCISAKEGGAVGHSRLLKSELVCVGFLPLITNMDAFGHAQLVGFPRAVNLLSTFYRQKPNLAAFKARAVSGILQHRIEGTELS